MQAPLTLAVTYTYDHTSGVFIGHLPNGTTFRFIAADQPTELGPPAAIPIKLRMELHRLARQQVDMAKQLHQAKERELNSPLHTDEEFHEAVERYLAAGGIITTPRKRKAPGAYAHISLEDLGL